MFNTISWQSYWTALAISLAIYYLAIFLLYYRNDFIHRLARVSSRESTTSGSEEFKHPINGTEEATVYSCMDEINAFFEEAKKRKWQKDEMIYSLHSIMKKYPSIKTSGYKPSVSNVLLNQCEHVCNIHINAEELEHVWLGS